MEVAISMANSKSKPEIPPILVIQIALLKFPDKPEKMAFYKMEKLTQIDLSNNWLTYVDPYIFTDLATPEWTVDVTTNPFICDCGIEGKYKVYFTWHPYQVNLFQGLFDG